MIMFPLSTYSDFRLVCYRKCYLQILIPLTFGMKFLRFTTSEVSFCFQAFLWMFKQYIFFVLTLTGAIVSFKAICASLRERRRWTTTINNAIVVLKSVISLCYYRPRTKYDWKVMFSVCMSVHRGIGVLPLVPCLGGKTEPGVTTPPLPLRYTASGTPLRSRRRTFLVLL